MLEGNKVLIINPLGAALDHYTQELKQVLEETGLTVECRNVVEPSSSGRSRVSWGTAYVRELWRARALGHSKVIITWPTIGYLDLILVRLLLRQRGTVVVHDTRPLVRALGYGKCAQSLAALLGTGSGLVVHSGQGRSDIDNQALRRRAVLLPHPMRRPCTPKEFCQDRRVVVRTLGQYKPDRDVKALEVISSTVSDKMQLEIVGRRWPEVDGWHVTPEFVPEERMAELVRTSAVVVIPYKRFYQSGIAIRCLEEGTPFVGPGRTSLDDLIGPGSPALVGSGEDWARAIEYALSEAGTEALHGAAEKWYTKSVREWKNWLEEK